MSRIPQYQGPRDLLKWLSKMAEQGLLFHPDDPPETIVSMDNPTVPLFTPTEAGQLAAIIPVIHHHWGDEMYEAFMAYGMLPRG